MLGVMRTFWKVFAALALMLPLGAFVAGTLVSASAHDPRPRETVILQDSTDGPDPTSSPSGEPADDEPGEDGSVAVVTPTPDDFGDDNAGDDNGDDNSGPGSDDSGSGDNSGSGSDDSGSGSGSDNSGPGSDSSGSGDGSGHG